MSLMLDKLIHRIFGFSIVGVISSLLSLLLIFVGNELIGLNVYVVYFLSYIITILVSYFLNARYVWKHELRIIDVVKYFGIYISSMILGMLLLMFFELLMPNLNHTILSFLTIPFTMAWNYLFVNYIFKNNE